MTAHTNTQPQLSNETQARAPVSIGKLQSLRWLLFLLVTLFISTAVSLRTHVSYPYLAVTAGVFLAGRFLAKGKTFGNVLVLHIAVLVIGSLLLRISNWLIAHSSTDAQHDFLISRISDDFLIVLIFYALSFLSTWAYWTKPWFLTLEAIASAVGLVALLSAHRNYHVDAPKEISSLAWNLGILRQYHAEPQHLFIAVGLLFVALFAIYLALSFNRQLFFTERRIQSHSPTSTSIAVLAPILMLATLLFYGRYLSDRFSKDIGRVANGVSTQVNEEGKSNLGFHEATAATKQPSALVRLEGDFEFNPWAPMLYLREGALSRRMGLTGTRL